MGKRSSFERIQRDFYRTTAAAGPPLIPHLVSARSPSRAVVTARWCATWKHSGCTASMPTLDHYGAADAIITNPPYTRPAREVLLNYPV
jgi:hypothetical protein